MSAPVRRLLVGRFGYVGLAAALAAAGCGDGGGGAPAAPAAPTAPAAPQPSISVTFVEDAARVAEGQTTEIEVRWSGGAPSSALRIGVTARNVSATDDDYELLTSDFEIAPSATSGTAAVSLRALEDEFFAEGDEIVSLELSAPAGASVGLAGGLEVAIEDAGVSPCAGIRVAAEPPLRTDHWPPDSTEQPSETARSRFIIVSGPGSEAISVDWIGPYRDYDLASWNPSFRPRRVNPTNLFHAILETWSFSPKESAMRHEFRVEWLSELELGLRFRSADSACIGEPVAVCSGTGCELRP